MLRFLQPARLLRAARSTARTSRGRFYWRSRRRVDTRCTCSTVSVHGLRPHDDRSYHRLLNWGGSHRFPNGPRPAASISIPPAPQTSNKLFTSDRCEREASCNCGRSDPFKTSYGYQALRQPDSATSWRRVWPASDERRHQARHRRSAAALQRRTWQKGVACPRTTGEGARRGRFRKDGGLARSPADGVTHSTQPSCWNDSRATRLCSINLADSLNTRRLTVAPSISIWISIPRACVVTRHITVLRAVSTLLRQPDSAFTVATPRW